jgi:ribosomal-protein-alanine N-acetyltransferase
VYTRNREHVAPGASPTPGVFTEAAQRGEVVGRVNLTNIAGGVFHNASLGYWVDYRHTGAGVAAAAIRSPSSATPT